jgi:hypothetical protein
MSSVSAFYGAVNSAACCKVWRLAKVKSFPADDIVQRECVTAGMERLHLDRMIVPFK